MYKTDIFIMLSKKNIYFFIHVRSLDANAAYETMQLLHKYVKVFLNTAVMQQKDKPTELTFSNT